MNFCFAIFFLVFSMAAIKNPSDIEGDPANAAPTSQPAVVPIADAAVPELADAGVGILPQVRLTPRQLDVPGLAVSRIDLNGTWNFIRDVPADFTGAPQSITQWNSVSVPGHFALQGFPRMHAADGVPVAYARTFDIPAEWAQRRVVLRFEGVDGLTQLWINRQPAGRSDLACLPSEFDITSLIRVGQANEICLTVEKSLVTRWSRRELGGITRDVYVQALPTLNLARLHVDTDLSADHSEARINVHLRIANQSDTPAKDVRVNLTLIDPNGTQTLLNAKPFPLASLAAGQMLEIMIPQRVVAPRLWSAESPRLYHVRADLLLDDQLVMSARQRFGFREVHVESHKLLLNGQPIKLRGTNYHITYPGMGESVPRDLIRKDLVLFQQANLNTIRPRPTPSIDCVELCDELGIYTTVEAMISLMMYDAGVEKDHGANPAMRLPYRRHVATMIESYYSNPSVLTWGLGNECPYYDYFQTAAVGMKSADRSRPLFFGSDARLGVDIPLMDINDDHYPRDGTTSTRDPGAIVGKGWDYPKDRPNIFTEWMHVHTNNAKEVAFDPGIDDFWGYVAEAHIEYMDRTPEYAGGFLFKGAPYRGVGVNTIWRGIFDEQRRVNDMYWHTLKAHSPIHLADRAGTLDAGGTVARFELTNRYDFTDLSAVRFQWRRESRSGDVHVSLPPHARGWMEVPFDESAATNLEARDARGQLIDQWNLSLASATRPAPQALKPAETWNVRQDPGGISVVAGDREFRIDTTTGLLVWADVAGVRVVDGSPTLLVLPSQLMRFRGQELLTLVNQARNWKPSKVSIEQPADVIRIIAEGTYDQIPGRFITEIRRTGELWINYDFQWTTKPEKPLNCFAWGIAIPMTPACDELWWDRAAQWSAYPDNHIGRPIGTARAAGKNGSSGGDAAPYIWSQDIIDGVTRDFRSTKFFVHAGGLHDSAGRGLAVRSDASQHLQVVPINGNLDGAIAVEASHGPRRPGFFMHVLRFHNGGTEPHLTKSLQFERLELLPDVRFSDSVHLELGTKAR